MSGAPSKRGVLTGELVAHHWPICVGLVILCGIGNWLIGWTPFDLPLLDFPVPGWSFTIAITVVLLLPPLMSSFPDIEPTLARERPMRIVRSITVCLLIALAAAPTYLHDQSNAGRHVMLVYAGLLLAIGLISVATIGNWAWVPPLGIGIMIIMLDHGLTTPVSALLVHVPVYVTLIAAAAAGVLYCAAGAHAP